MKFLGEKAQMFVSTVQVVVRRTLTTAKSRWATFPWDLGRGQKNQQLKYGLLNIDPLTI